VAQQPLDDERREVLGQIGQVGPVGDGPEFGRASRLAAVRRSLASDYAVAVLAATGSSAVLRSNVIDGGFSPSARISINRHY